MRIAVVGVGAIGGYFAAQAARAGHELVLCTRTPFAQLELQTLDGAVQRVDAPVHTDPEAIRAEGPADWVLLGAKAHQTDACRAWLEILAGEGTRAVVALQNGVEHEERVRPYIGDTPLLPSTVLCGSEAPRPGYVVHHGFARLEVPRGSLAEELAQLFEGVDASISPVDDMRTTVWRKLLTNVCASPITALTGQRLRVMTRPELRNLAVGLVREAIEVARAEGASIEVRDAEALVDGYAEINPEMGSSMLYDRQAGRPTEIDALNGAVVRIGARHGIPTPLNDAVVGLLTVIDDPA